MKQISMDKFHQLVNEDQELNIIDVRLEGGFNSNHIEGAVNIPLSTLPNNLNQLDKNKHYYIICQVGASSSQGTQFLQQNGYNVTNVESGMMAYPGETSSNTSF